MGANLLHGKTGMSKEILEMLITTSMVPAQQLQASQASPASSFTLSSSSGASALLQSNNGGNNITDACRSFLLQTFIITNCKRKNSGLLKELLLDELYFNLEIKNMTYNTDASKLL